MSARTVKGIAKALALAAAFVLPAFAASSSGPAPGFQLSGRGGKTIDLAQFKGQVVMPNPASSGTGFFDVTAWLALWGDDNGKGNGWRYMDKLHENIAQYTHSGSKPCNMAAAGEYVVGISFEYRANTNKAKGAPIELVFPKEGLGWDLEAFAIHKGTKKLQAAQKLAEAGLSVVGVERDLVGGECPFFGCIPSKMMVRAADALAEARRVPRLAGEADVRPNWGSVAARIDKQATNHWRDDSHVERLERAGVRIVRGEGRLDGPGRVRVGEDYWLGATIPGFALTRRRQKPLYDASFHLPQATRPDRRLILGAVLFGLGWGWIGYCPGPALTALFLVPTALPFIAAMLAGMILFAGIRRRWP